jgi:hypothetical protein
VRRESEIYFVWSCSAERAVRRTVIGKLAWKARREERLSAGILSGRSPLASFADRPSESAAARDDGKEGQPSAKETSGRPQGGIVLTRQHGPIALDRHPQLPGLVSRQQGGRRQRRWTRLASLPYRRWQSSNFGRLSWGLSPRRFLDFSGTTPGSPRSRGAVLCSSCCRNDFVWSHHFVVLVLKVMAVPHVAAGIADKWNDDPGNA